VLAYVSARPARWGLLKFIGEMVGRARERIKKMESGDL